MDITQIVGLLSAEKTGTPNSWVNQASSLQNGCHNYKLTGSTACESDLDAVTLYLDIPAFSPLIYKRIRKGRETGKGQEVNSWWAVEPVVRFTIVMDEAARNKLEILSEHVTRKFTRITGDGSPQEADIAWMEVTASEEETWLRVEVQISFADSLIINKLCCGSFYDEAPVPECDGEGETGDPNNDPTCEGLVVAITLEAGPVLLATPSGGTATGTETYTWYLDGVFFGEGASIMPTLSGVYRVDYQIGNCYATQEFTYSAPCEDFEITVQELILGDGSTLLVAQPNMITTSLQWQMWDGDSWEDVVGETSLIFQPDTAGEYRVTGTTAGACTDDSPGVTVEVAVDCSGLFDIELENTGGNIVGTVTGYTGEGTPAFQWWFDSGDGSGATNTGNTGESIPVGDPGLYIWVVTIDGCVISKHIFVNCEQTANPCGDPCGFPYQSFGPGVTGDEFSVTNFVLLDPDLYTEDQINATYHAFKNGVKVEYISPVNMAAMLASDNRARTVWSIDYATQRATLHPGWPLKVTEILIVTRIR